MNKAELETAYAQLQSEHETVVAERDELLDNATSAGPDTAKAVESATRQIRGECEAQIKAATEANENLAAENERLKEIANEKLGKKKGVNIVARGPDPFAGSGIENGDVVATVVIKPGLTFTAIAEAGYYGRAGVQRQAEEGGGS